MAELLQLFIADLPMILAVSVLCAGIVCLLGRGEDEQRERV